MGVLAKIGFLQGSTLMDLKEGSGAWLKFGQAPGMSPGMKDAS